MLARDSKLGLGAVAKLGVLYVKDLEPVHSLGKGMLQCAALARAVMTVAVQVGGGGHPGCA